MHTSGYSPRSLSDKLGISEDKSNLILHAPKDYQEELLESIPADTKLTQKYDFIQAFYSDFASFNGELPELVSNLEKNGSLWISWPKGSSGVKTDLNENIIREAGLAAGVVDVKVIAIDTTWSGLKFVFRLKDRAI